MQNNTLYNSIYIFEFKGRIIRFLQPTKRSHEARFLSRPQTPIRRMEEHVGNDSTGEIRPNLPGGHRLHLTDGADVLQRRRLQVWRNS